MSNTIEETRLIQILNKFEVQCVTGNFTADDCQIDIERYKLFKEYKLIQDLDALMKNVSNHEYKKALQTNSEFFKPFKVMCKDLTLVFYEMYSEMKSNYQYLFHSGNGDCSYVKQLILLLVGISALQEFVKVNICGPIISDSTVQDICSSFLPDSYFSDESVLSALGQNGEVILTRIAHPKLLFLSLMLLFGNIFDKCLTHKWWLSRCMMIHQKILPDASTSLYRTISSLIHSQAEISFLNDKSELLAAFMFNCECAQFFLFYKELNVAERYIINAQNILGFGVKLSACCVRSLDKDNEVQHGVVVKRNDTRYRSNLIVYENCALPKCFLDFDRWRNNMVLLDHDSKEIDELLPEEQVVLLLYCSLLMKRGYNTDIIFEDDLAMLDCLISKPKIWSLQMKTLILRCIETEFVQDVHINQVNELLLHVRNDISLFSHKLVLFYCVSLPMIYDIYKILADLLFNKGCILDASVIYREFNLWKGSINCYKRLEMVLTGVKVLEELIAIRPSPLLWCYLGNLRNKSEIYQVAWDSSHHSNARAARYMGYYFYKKETYDSSIFHFKESLKLNPMQPNVLLHMGLAALACKDFTLAVEAFNSILEMDVDNCEAWTYLCKAYIETDDKINACRCFLETLTFDGEKMDRMRRKFWENYLWISAKIGAFSDVISGFHSFLDEKDLKPSTDMEVLKILVNAIKTDTPDIHHIASSKLKRKALKLFKRMTAQKCHSPIVWELYSVLMCVGADFRKNMSNTEKIIACQQRAIKHYIAGLEKNKCSFEQWGKNRYSVDSLLKLMLRCVNLFHIFAVNLRFKPGMKRKEIISFNEFHLFLTKAVPRVKSLTLVSPEARNLLCEIEQKFENIISFCV